MAGVDSLESLKSECFSRAREVSGVKVYNCPICNYEVTHRKDSMERHLKCHLKEKKDTKIHECGNCETKFSSKFSLQRHVRLKHNGGLNEESQTRKRPGAELDNGEEKKARMEEEEVDIAISLPLANESGEGAAVIRDLVSEILEDVIKHTSSEEAVPGPEPEAVSALPTSVVEINCTGPDITVCPGSDHSYARVAELDMVVEDCTALPLQVSAGDSSHARVATVTSRELLLNSAVVNSTVSEDTKRRVQIIMDLLKVDPLATQETLAPVATLIPKR